MALSVHNGVTGHERPAKRPRGELNGGGDRWVVRGSRQSQDCVNPVRSCEEKYFSEPMERRDKTKELIKLSIGEWVCSECQWVCSECQ